MICPYCKSEKTHIESTRKHQNVIFRWRICQDCGKGFTTEETRSSEKIVENPA